MKPRIESNLSSPVVIGIDIGKELILRAKIYRSVAGPARQKIPPRAREGGAHRLEALRLLAEQTAEVLAAISRALNGLALLVADPARPVPRRGGVRLRVPDWLPSLVNAGRAFVVIGAAELFWIVTVWPNGAQAITFAAVGVILLAPRADQAYAAAKSFM